MAASGTPMRFLLTSILAASLAYAQFPTDSRGIIQTGLSAAQDSLLGPLIQDGASPFPFGDLAEKATASNIAPAAIAEVPVLGSALAGTVSWTQGTGTVTTTNDLTSTVAVNDSIVIAWTTVDGALTGRTIMGVSGVTSTTLTFYTNNFAPTSSGVTIYKISSATDSHGLNYNSWVAQTPAVTWNYYDVAIGLYRLYYRTGNTTYQTQARAFADINWQWVIDHGYTFPNPRAASMISQFFRALDGHSERFPGLYNEITNLVRLWGDPTASPAIDNREAGYTLWDVALGAKTDTDPTRHAQYCTWLATFVPTWNSVQAADGSWPENEYALNPTFASAPKTFTNPFLFQGAPWREAINVKAMEAAYEALNNPADSTCYTPSLATSTLTAITNAVTWQNNYGRDTSNRGIYYELNSQSNDQSTVIPAGTASITRTSTALTGVGTNWQTAGYCDGTHFIGFRTPGTIYKIASCTSDTAATLSVAYGLYGESSNLSGSTIAVAPAASTGAACHSSATYCYNGTGDRNLTRTVCGGIAWLYSVTFNPTFLGWANECLSAQLGGPTAGLTSAVSIPSFVLPCSGVACDGYVSDAFTAAPDCSATGNVPPCVFGGSLYGNLGKNFGEAFGAPGIDNALAWIRYRLNNKYSQSGKGVSSSKAAN